MQNKEEVKTPEPDKNITNNKSIVADIPLMPKAEEENK